MQRDSAQADDTELKVQRLDKVYSFPDEDFDRKYAPDDFGDEASDHARVWKVYRDEARPRDEKKIEGWNRTFDVLLTFAGLYSAALTAFLVESYQTLKQDSTDYTADILFRIASLNPSANISQSDRASDAIRPPDKGYTPSTPMLWVNGLWFTSLALTLGVAFLCILAKQWLYEHERMLFDRTITARRWTQEHVLRSHALETWHIAGLVSGLPTVLHTALFLFMAGLFVFLREFNEIVAGLIALIGGPVLLFFIIQLFTPILALSCSWRSPFGRAIEDITLVITVQILRVGPVCRAGVTRVSSLFVPARSLLPCFRPGSEARRSTAPGAPVAPASSSRAEGAEPSRAAADDSPHVPRSGWSHRARLDAMLAKEASHLEAVALRRLLRSPTRSVVATAIQAIGSIRPTDPTITALTRLPRSEGDSADAADARVRGYIVSRSKDMTSEQRARNPRVTYEAVHCIKAWASLTKLKEQLVKDKSIFHNPYHTDRTLPFDVQVISALMSDFTPAWPGDTNFELSDIATVFRNTPYESQRFRLHPSTLRLLSDILGADIDKLKGQTTKTTVVEPTNHDAIETMPRLTYDRVTTGTAVDGDAIDTRDDGNAGRRKSDDATVTARPKISKRLISELAVLHGLLSICLVSWLTGEDWPDSGLNDFTELCPLIAPRCERVWQIDHERVRVLPTLPSRSQEIWNTVSRLRSFPNTLPNAYRIVWTWLTLSRFWLEAQDFDDIDGSQKEYTAGPHPRNIAALLLLCGQPESSRAVAIRHVLRQDELFWDVLHCQKIKSSSWTLADTVVLLDVYIGSRTDQTIYSDTRYRTLAALIRMAGKCLGPQQPLTASLACFRDYSAKVFVDLEVEDVVLSDFLAEQEGTCAWRVLHAKVCSDGVANANVLNIAAALTKKLTPTNEYTDVFFSNNALEHCIAGAYETRLYAIGEALLRFDTSGGWSDIEDYKKQLKQAEQNKHLETLRMFMMEKKFRDVIVPTVAYAKAPYETIIGVIYDCAYLSRQRTALALRNITGDELPHLELEFLASVHNRLTNNPTGELITFLDSNKSFSARGTSSMTAAGPSTSSKPAS